MNQNKEHKSKNILIYILIIALVISIATSLLLLFSLSSKNNKEKTSVSNNQESATDVTQETIEDLMATHGGSRIIFEANTDKAITEEDITAVEAIFDTRLQAAGYTNFRFLRYDSDKISVEIPSAFETDEIVGLLQTTARLTFTNVQTGEVVLDGSDIKEAEYRQGKLSETSPNEAYIELTFKPEAVEKFAKATREAIGGQIAIMMDDLVVSTPAVNEEIISDKCIISGDFTPESAQQLANQIKSGALPFSLKIISQETVSAK